MLTYLVEGYQIKLLLAGAPPAIDLIIRILKQCQQFLQHSDWSPSWGWVGGSWLRDLWSTYWNFWKRFVPSL